VIRDGAVVYEAVYPHPVQRVWRALVDPAELAEWLMPSAGFAPVVGQRFIMACDPFGEIEAEVLECAPQAAAALECRFRRHGGVLHAKPGRRWHAAHAAARPA
jgi:uncharacterized protein YndB with AHSA1/START domain